jgi:hypothetical protein
MWNEWYASFIRHSGFLPLARLVIGGLLMMDFAALTALVDRWRLETHTFHLLCGETMVMVQDVTMILGLPIDNTLICEPVPSAWWRGPSKKLSTFDPPPDIPVDQKDKKTMVMHSGWLTAHFDTYSEGDEGVVVHRYDQSCLWHMDDK